LSGPGPFTLFAPNNGAFSALPDDLLEKLLSNAEFIPHLRDLLLYHVLSGVFFNVDFENGANAETLNSETFLVNVSPSFTVDGVSVIGPNNGVANGVVHIIDQVLTPSWVTNPITNRVVSDADLTTLLALVIFAELADTLAAPGEFTLVAPTNEAFAKLPATTVEFLTSEEGGKEALIDLLLYHVFAGIFVSNELSDGIIVETLQGGTVEVSVGDSGVFFNFAEAVEVDILANNGVVHKIDTVLMPNDGAVVGLRVDTSLIEFVATNPDLTTLTAAVVRAGLLGTLSSDGPFTLFAPDNDAFLALSEDIVTRLFENDEFLPHLTNLLLYHVLIGESSAGDLAELADGMGAFLETANGEDIDVTFPPIEINGNLISSADNDVTNGVIHIIHGVLTPSWVTNSITDRVIGDSDLSTLLSLVVIAELGDALAGPGELTLVAPTNDAFAKLSAATVDLLTSEEGKDTLIDILLYHVFAGIFVSSELSDGIIVGALQGGTVEVSVGDNGVFFNDAEVAEVDILANNGVVHKIDTVLDPAFGAAESISASPSPSQVEALPEDGNIVDFVVGNPDLTSLTAAVVRAGLVDALKTDGPFTLFAPNDDAFAAVSEDLLNTLLTNDEFIPHLVDLLVYHVLMDESFAADLIELADSNGGSLETATGEDIDVTFPPLEINGNKVLSADNVVSNGVVHIIDGVLVPSWVFNSIADRVIGASDLSTLFFLVGIAELGDALAGPGELTLVAPTNDAFAKLSAATVVLLTSEEGKATLIDILLYHVFDGIFVANELFDGSTVSTLQGGTVDISVDDAGGFFNNAKILEVDILANNGVVHKIDTVLDPADGNSSVIPSASPTSAPPSPVPSQIEALPEDGSAVGFVVGNPDLTSLTAAVVRVGLVDTLGGPGTFTLFAPNNDAFAAVSGDLLTTLLTNDEFIPHLTDLLLYHVLDDELLSIHFFNFRTLALNGEFLLIMPTGINGNNVVSADNDVTNGVVHILDGVLIPSWVTSSITDRVIGASDLSTLLSLVVLAELGDALAGAGELTLVAPTNDAFAKLSAATVVLLTSTQGKATLTQILLYHVFDGIFVSSELSDGITVETLQGGTVEVSVGNAGVFFNNAKAVEVDILANNGVVHKIDTVLDPADGEDEGLPTATIVDFVVGNPDLTSLAAAVVRAGLVDTLNSEGPFTLFAPNDSAFGAVPVAILNTLLTNDEFIPHLVNLLLYHVLTAEVFALDLFNGLTVSAANGEPLLITLPPVAVNSNKVVSADNDVSNGVVHILDGVLIPSWVTSSITDRVIGASDLSTLLSLVVIAELGDALSGAGELTLVAPTNDAFAELSAATVVLLTSEEGKNTLIDILLYHVFVGIFVSSELSNDITVDTLQGGTVEVSVGNAGVFFNDAKAVEVDVLANNGVVHKIDTVLDPADGADEGLPEPERMDDTVFDYVAGNPELTSLAVAVVRAGLANTLDSAGAFTLFAPNDDAFSALPSAILDTLLMDDEFIPHLKDLLLYHVLGRKLFTNMHPMFNGMSLSALNGETLSVSRPPLDINDSRVIERNIDASNGVVNIVRKVLIPSWVTSSIVDRVVAARDLSILLALVELADLGGALSAPGALTVVAPTNNAFAKLPDAVAENLTSEEGKDTLIDILLYHVFPGIFVSSELSDGITVDTLQGDPVIVRVFGQAVFFNDAKAIEVDILANNGVVHKIDAVLDPFYGEA
jgi:transforming growth factor-beta-induced protein